MRIGIDARFYGPIKQKGLGRYVQKLVEGLEKVVILSPPGAGEESRGIMATAVSDGILRLCLRMTRDGGILRRVYTERSECAQNDKGRRDCFVGLRPPCNDKKETTPCRDIEFIIFLRKENWDEYQPKNPNFKKVLADYPWYGLAEQIFFPWKIRQAKVDLMHFPHFNAPLFCGRPFIVTIHDLILKKYPTNRASKLGSVGYFIKNLGYNFVINSVVRRAKKIIAVSEYTKNDILRYFKVGAEKVRVIYEGAPVCHCEGASEASRPKQSQPVTTTAVSDGILRSSAHGELAQNDRLDSRLRGNDTKGVGQGAKGRYLLYAGNAYPHKNLERLVSAFQELNQEYPDLKLILVGELDYFYRRLKAAVPAVIREKIIFTDFVSDEQLMELYRKAELYVFPSLCEGFGLPPLEAMACGLPVVCSGNSCLPEILGEAALYFDPENVKDMAEKIKLVLENRELKKKLTAAGRRKVKKYGWQKMAEETIDVYKIVR